MAQDFQTFLKQLEASGELKRVAAEVDPFLEAGAIADRVAKQPGGGRALRFDRIKGAAMPVAMNVFGSARRMAMALGVDQDPAGLDAVAARIEKLIQEAMPKPGAGLPGEARQAAAAGGGGGLDAQDRAQGPLPGRGLARRRGARSPACRCSPPGPRTAAPSSPWA